MKKSGFTLVELLAIIIVLSIVALISIPVAAGVIENSRRESARISATNYIKQLEAVIVAKEMKENVINNGSYELDSDGNIWLDEEHTDKLYINIKGKKPSGGTVVISDGKASTGTSVIVGNYAATINEIGSIIVTKENINDLNDDDDDEPEEQNIIVSGLPEEYQEVEWIAGDDSGNPMIEVGQVSSLNTVIKFNARLKRINNGSGYPAFLSTLDYNNTQLLINQHPNIGTEAFFYATFGNIKDKYSGIQNGFRPLDDFYDYELNKDELVIKDYGSITLGATSISSCTICILGKAHNNSKSDAYFKSFKVYDGDTILYDLVPCYRKSDNVIGMYDVVTKRFLTNSRTGSLTKGPDVISDEYVALQYIESDGTQYIDTNFTPNQDTKVLMNINVVNPEYCRLYGAYSGASWTSDSYGAYFNAYGNTFWVNYNSDTNIPDFGITQGVKCKIYQDKNKFYVDDVLKGTLTEQNSFSPNTTMYIMALNRSGESRKGEFRLYDFKIWDNDTLVRDLVPCYRVSDGEIGMYDKVNKVFYENAGTGTFIKGY